MAYGGVVTHQFSDPVLRKSLFAAFKAYNETAPRLWKKIGFQENDSDKAFEEITEFAPLGVAVRREQLQQAAFDAVKEGYTTRINQYAYSLAMAVSEEAIRNKQYKEAIDGIAGIRESIENTIEILCADVLGNAFSTTLGLLPDGYPICSASHKLPRGGTFSTYIGASSFTETAIEAALIKAAKMPGGHGIAVGVTAKRVIIPEDYRFEAKRILKSELQAGTANNALNALKDENLQIVTNRFLASSSNWFVGTDAKNGLMLFWTQKPEVREFGNDITYSVIYTGNTMFGTGVPNPRCLLGSDI